MIPAEIGYDQGNKEVSFHQEIQERPSDVFYMNHKENQGREGHGLREFDTVLPCTKEFSWAFVSNGVCNFYKDEMSAS